MRTRIAVGVVFATISVFALAAVARACESVSGSVSPSSAAAGDPIRFSFSGLDPDASYRATIEGQQMASGVNGASFGGVGGSFSMPNYGGQPRTVYVTLYASHSEDNFEWNRSFPVQYVPPVRTSDDSQVSSSAPAPEPAVRTHERRPQRVESQRPVTVADQA